MNRPFTNLCHEHVAKPPTALTTKCKQKFANIPLTAEEEKVKCGKALCPRPYACDAYPSLLTQLDFAAIGDFQHESHGLLFNPDQLHLFPLRQPDDRVALEDSDYSVCCFRESKVHYGALA